MKKFFVIGNGESRRSINLQSLNGTTIGCNALYRDFTPNHLVIVDDDMLKEVIRAKYDLDHSVFTWSKGWVKDLKNKTPCNVKFISKRGEIFYFHNWNAGSTATYVATLLSPREKSIIYLLGLDFKSLNDKGTINNIYAGTQCYGKGSGAEFDKNIKKVLQVIKENKHHQFIRVCDQNSANINTECKNYTEITVEDFKKDHGS